MDPADLDYELPPAAIAQVPVEPRDSARLLVDRGPAAGPDDRHVRDLPGLVGPGDLVVVNRSQVVPARIAARKETGGAVEVLLVEERRPGCWHAMVKPSRRVAVGSVLTAGPLSITVGEPVGERADRGRVRRVELVTTDGGRLDEAIRRVASLALPPYLISQLADPDRYQTVFADRPGSVAAPTAGLHLTDALLGAIEAAGATIARVDLAVGLGTFVPVTAERFDDHIMHEERFEVPDAVLAAAEAADRVVAVGTTTVRALEAAARGGSGGRTDLFIRPGFEFRVVDALLTNFHQPRSTLLALLAAFVGPRWRDLYEHAVRQDYRFLSFGDAMFLPGRTA